MALPTPTLDDLNHLASRIAAAILALLRRRRWIPWATMLLKVFAVDALACPNCQGRLQRIVWMTHPPVINVILACVETKPQPS